MSDWDAVSRPVASGAKDDPWAAVSKPVAKTPKPAPKQERGFVGKLVDVFTNNSIAKDRQRQVAEAQEKRQVAQRRDVASNDGFFDRAGDLLSRGTASVAAGLERLGSTILPERTRQSGLTSARRNEAIASTLAPNEVTWSKVKERPNAANIGKFVVEQSVQSLPGMATAAAALPAFIASQVGNIAQQRAVNDGREDATGMDAVIAAPAGVASALLERVGIKGIFGPAAGNTVVRIGKAGGKEAITEGGQSFLEYGGGSVGTDTGFDLATALDQSLAGSVAGAGMGTAGRSIVEAPQVIARAAEATQGARSLVEAMQLPAPDVPVPSAPLEPVAQPLVAAPVQSWDEVSQPVVSPPPSVAEAPVAPAPVADPQPVVPEGDGGLGAVPTAEPGEKLVRTPAGNKVRTRFEVVDASTLAKAEGEMQNRDRTRDTTALQVQDIIAKFDPELLGDDPSSDRGAPIIGGDNVVYSGNGRMLALNRIFDEFPDKAATYRQFIEAQGHKTDGIERPVLVRRIAQDMTPDELRQFVVESNKDTKLELSPVERARSDADTITPDLLAKYAGGDLNGSVNRGFVESFTKNLTAGEMGNFIGSDRRLTTAGLQRVENAVVAAAYGKPKLLERMMESAHDDIRAITSSLADVAPSWAKMRQSAKAGEIDAKYDITDDLADAAARVSDARKRGTKPADILTQVDAFDQMSPVAETLIQAFYNSGMTRAASRKAVTDFLQDYIKAANAQTTTEGLFGAEPGKAPADILKGLLEQRDKPQGDDLFDAPFGDGRRKKERAPDDSVDEESLGDFDTEQDGHAKKDKGSYQPGFEEASFTSRQSAYDSAIRATGLTEEKFNLLPPRRKAKLLVDALERLTGIKATIAPDMPLQYAIDQLLDAHQTLQGMASVLGIAPRALSLGGTLKLKLVGKAGFLGSYSHGKAEVTLPKRSNSFSHEWGHALDYYLLDRVSDEQARGLSGLVREQGARFQPANTREAFVKLLNAMFFDGAEIAAKVMRLQQQIAKTNSDKQKAALQTQIDNIMSGRSRAKEKSRYWKGADATNKQGGDGDYWTRPTEMLARAFEAWIGFKLANAGFGSEFIGKGNDNYLSDAEDRFRLTFPKGEERVAIFDAFEDLIATIEIEAAPGVTPEALSGFNDEATPEMRQELGRARNRHKNVFARVLGADLEAVETWFHNRKVDAEENSRRAGDPVRIASKINNVRALAFSAAADGVKMVSKRWNSKAALRIHDHFAADLGGKRHVTRTFGDAVEIRENKALNPIFKELERVGGKGWVYKKLTREQRDTLAALLNGREVVDDMGLSRLANVMRRTFNDEWYENRNAGIDLGYVNDAGYLNRQIDRELVAGDPDRFMVQAEKVYEHVFDRDVGKDAEAVAGDPERLEQFVAIAKRNGLEGFKELRQAIRDEGENVAELVADMFADVRGAFALQAAADYRDSILNEETFRDFTATATLPDSEKKRALPAQADALLRDFYNPDPVSSAVNYVVASVRRTEWNKRFGRPAGTKASGPTIGEQLDKQMAREGVPASERRYVWNLVDRMSGRYRRTNFLAHPGVNGLISFMRVKGTLAMMGRAFTLSLFEPASLGIVTGNPIHGVKAVAKTWANILHKGSRDEMMEWSRAQGFIKHHMLEQFRAMDRFQTTSDQPTRFDKLGSWMFRNTGLTFLTAASDAAVVDVGRRGILNEMAHRVTNGGARGEEAENLMRELGIRDPKTFAQQLVDMGNALPPAEWLQGAEGFDYNTALKRLERMAIQKPDAAELTPLSRNPLASYATYSITAYIQSAYRNLLKRNIIRGTRMAQDQQYEMLVRFSAGTIASAGLLYALQFLASVTREYLFNPDRQEEWEKKGDWLESHAALAATRTFSFGALDPFISSWKGLRYNRDLTYLPAGAYAGADLQNLTKIGKMFVKNSAKTNTAEHNALQGFYNFALAPALSAGVNAAPGGGPVSTLLSGGATATGTGPIAANEFADAIVGEKHGRIGEDGKKVKSGPTTLDKL